MASSCLKEQRQFANPCWFKCKLIVYNSIVMLKFSVLVTSLAIIQPFKSSSSQSHCPQKPPWIFPAIPYLHLGVLSWFAPSSNYCHFFSYDFPSMSIFLWGLFVTTSLIWSCLNDTIVCHLSDQSTSKLISTSLSEFILKSLAGE